MADKYSILSQYWGYPSFRPPQDLIIDNVVEGRDTLALLPTGGGKSLCFQVPAMLKEGICIVISPLVALMRDQVKQLKDRDIKAAALFSGLSSVEMEIILNNSELGYYKFLYISPERLQSEAFQNKLKNLPVSLLAVDEAHCISQWGHDFRPSYRNIALFREIYPHIPIIALTASATPLVQDDIIQQLKLTNYTTFTKSYLRPQLSFVSRQSDVKMPKLLDAVKKIRGSQLIYVRNRQKTKEIADFLIQNNIKASYYHAGLSHIERHQRQEDWISNRTQVMCCTNAFGMGIDKPDVRLVIHYDLPESLEAYYQEAGRAGRDQKPSYALTLYHQDDIFQLYNHIETQFPPLDVIKKIYNALGNYCRVAIGSGKFSTHEFELYRFCNTFHLEALPTYHALKILEEGGYIAFSEAFHLPSRLMFLSDNFTLYKFQVEHPQYEPIIKFLLRNYGGILDTYQKINEKLIANKVKISVDDAVSLLKTLHGMKILYYIPSSESPKVTFTEERISNDNLRIDMAFLRERKKHYTNQLDAVKHYFLEPHICRQQMICTYFGEKNTLPCGICDHCVAFKNNIVIHGGDGYVAKILAVLHENSMPINDLLNSFPHSEKQKILHILRILADENKILINDNDTVACA